MRKLNKSSTTLLFTAAACLMFATCAKGITPPVATSMVVIETSEMLFGEDVFCSTSTATTCRANVTMPSVKVKVDSFAIDRHEVTNFQYEYCVARGACERPTGDNSGDISVYYGSTKYRNFPVVAVTWEMAKKYCIFVGKRLPTEVEWERAAQKKDNLTKPGRDRYVWGASVQVCTGQGVNNPICNRNSAPTKVMTNELDQNNVGVDVGTIERGKLGKAISPNFDTIVYDLGGNVEEWVSDKFNATASCKDDIPTTDFNGVCPNYISCDQAGLENITSCRVKAETCPACKDKDNNDLCHRAPTAVAGCCVTDTQNNPENLCYPICIKWGTDVVLVKGSANYLKEGTGNNHVIKGTSYIAADKCSARLTSRRSGSPSADVIHLGFRCASDYK